MSTVDAIKQALARADEAKALGINVGQEGCTPWVDNVRILLDEIDKLQTVVEAARELRKHYPLVWRESDDGEFCPICFEFAFNQDSDVFQHDKDCPVELIAAALAALDTDGKGA